MKVTFKEDQKLSYDGLNVKEYKKGETYEAQHPHEARVFESLVGSGVAEAPKDPESVSKSDTPAPKTKKTTAKKVTTPKSKK